MLDPGIASQKISTHYTEGMQMRAITREFGRCKRKFAKNARDIMINLPKPLENLNIDSKVVGGEITITKYMSFIF